MSTLEIFGLIGAGICLLLGIGVFVYAIRSWVIKFKSEYKETGFYPPGYYYFVGILYGLPVGIILMIFLPPYFESLGKWSNVVLMIPLLVPYFVIGYILTKKNAAKIRPRNEEENKKAKRYFPYFLIFVVLYILFKIFIQKG